MRVFILIFISLINLSAQNVKQSIETVISAFSEVKTDNRHLTPYLLEIAKNGQNLGYAVSYTHLTLPTILRV